MCLGGGLDLATSCDICLVATIAANSALAVQGVKQVLEHAQDHNEEDGLEYVAQWSTNFFLSGDLDEALQAFREKPEPRFSGEQGTSGGCLRPGAAGIRRAGSGKKNGRQAAPAC